VKRRDSAHPVTGEESTDQAAVAGSCSSAQAFRWGILFGFLSFLIHWPFSFHYGLYLGSDLSIVYLIPIRMLQGEFTPYLWGQDYMGLGPVDFLTAGAFRAFGPSIPMEGSIVLFFWAAGVALLVAYVAKHLGRSAGIGSGVALAIGVPYLIKFSTQVYGTQYNMLPLAAGGYLWLAVLLLQRGGRSWLGPLTALIMGWNWYADKLVVSVWASVVIAFALFSDGRAFLREFVRSKMFVLALIAFLIGYSPELLYKAGMISDRYGRIEKPSEFFSLASPALMARNWYMLFRCIPTYFDADPLSRSSNGVHYLEHLENWESFPLSAADTVGLIAAFLVISALIRFAWQSYQRKDCKAFMLAVCPFVNVLLLVVSTRTDGSYYNVRRYILTAGIILVLWTGVLLAESLRTKRWRVFAVLVLLFVISLFHQVQMLQFPDELADYKKLVNSIESHGYKYGMTWYSFAHTLTALSNEKVIFGILDRKFQSPYQQTVLAQDVVVFVWPPVNPPPFEFAQKLFFGGVVLKSDSTPKSLPDRIRVFEADYYRIGEPVIEGELGWAPYRKAYPSANPSDKQG
jgi:hypothetical protein